MRFAAVVSGASSGIGRETALHLAAQPGSGLVLMGRNHERLESVAHECEVSGAKVELVLGDVGEYATCSRAAVALKLLATSCGQNEDRRLVLVHAAGTAQFGPFSVSNPDDNQAQISSSLVGLMHLCHSVVPMMLEERSGHIVAVHSVAAIHAFPSAASYCAAKAGALQFCRSLALEVRKEGVRITSILPGSVDTPLWDAQSGGPDRNRMLQPSAVAQTILDVLQTPTDRSIDEIVLMPPDGIL